MAVADVAAAQSNTTTAITMAGESTSIQGVMPAGCHSSPA